MVILTIVDHFSKCVHYVPLPKLPSAAAEAGALLVLHVFRLHKIPSDIVSDRGPKFTSQVWRSFCALFGVVASLFIILTAVDFASALRTFTST